MKREMKRKGFTLVELLIVIVVIGILAAMMMLSSNEAVTSAKVSNITSNLRNLKTAALSFYNDSMDFFVKTPDSVLDNYQANIKKYLSGNADNPDLDYYIVSSSKANDNTWWVVYKISGSAAEVASIKNKLASRAKSLGLCGSANGPTKTSPTTALASNLANTVYTNQDFVALQVR